jgi:hypothetical protein
MLLVTTVLPKPIDRRAPIAARDEPVGDAGGQVMVRVRQPGCGADDPVPVGVGVAGERHLEPVAEAGQARHRVAGVGRPSRWPLRSLPNARPIDRRAARGVRACRQVVARPWIQLRWRSGFRFVWRLD